ncbi:TetR family transcriptional regulator [Micromonospora andamanensis]|uniref:TetR family transcriptional regulator n=1 Tax=Micromonospora andamanensis TaxID=1287068 RepID=A0ABQ4HU96_9ACTN|nr:TetR/AcrR family transcriptional regulator [Micromonospora andamanensis]GIJ09192.1 TetR family transcriptional regulator [Micromonospora andamanensis]GIJ37381.1 TetR family transcriptional regulator [Micromonospora andamanensis]
MADTPHTGKPLRADARRNRERVLAAAEEVFAEGGPAASTEEVARRAGVAIGTVFRHFPTKEELVQAVFAQRVRQLVDEAETLSTADDAGAAFFAFFVRLTELSIAKHAFADVLAGAGIDVGAIGRTHPQETSHLRAAVSTLLTRAQRAGAVREDVRTPEVLTVMIGIARAAEQTPSDSQVLARVLDIVFDGLRPAR